VHSQGFFMVQSVCPRCRGEGKIVREACTDCNGRRVNSETTVLSVTVPPGVDDGQTLRLAGKGEVAPGGGTAGHLYVVLHVVGDERFQREGEDILTEVPVSFVKAALGGEVEVPVLDDNCDGTAVVEVKPGTQPGDHVVRKGQGIPRVGKTGRGDQVVRWKVEIPAQAHQQAGRAHARARHRAGRGREGQARRPVQPPEEVAARAASPARRDVPRGTPAGDVPRGDAGGDIPRGDAGAMFHVGTPGLVGLSAGGARSPRSTLRPTSSRRPVCGELAGGLGAPAR
jgi:DnaJ-class molecular chaperone